MRERRDDDMGSEQKVENEIKWTPQQAHVIDTRKGNLLVAAAAGSGKTAVLVERIIQMVSGFDARGERIEGYDPVDVDELLVVTFTNAAAAQMKEKVGRELQKKIDMLQKDNRSDEHLIRQMTLINHAEICTIDSFCLRIVKEYFAKVQLDSAFDIGDDTEMKIIRKDVCDQVMEMCYEDENLVPGFRRLVKTFAAKEKDTAVAAIIGKVMGAISSYPDPHQWIENARHALTLGVDHSASVQKKRSAVMAMPMVAAFAGRVRSMLCAALDMAMECQKYATEGYGLAAYGLRIDQDVLMIQDMVNSCGDLTDQKNVDLFVLGDIYNASIRPAGQKMEKDADGQSICYAFDRLVATGADADPDKRDMIKSRRDVYKKMINDIIAFSVDVDDIISQMKMMAPTLTTVLDLTELYMDELMKVKMEKNLFEFHDIEEFAYRILCNGVKDGRPVPSEIGREVSARYREILIDEYQDSNFIQEYILGSVAGHGENINNMFMVGDMKQSIYKFRMARPDLFIGKYDTYVRLADDDEAKEDALGNCILLSRNFRSEINVLKTVNSIFSQVMMREIGDIEYDAAAQLNSRYAISGAVMTEPYDVYQGPKSELILIDNNMSDVDPYTDVTKTEVEAEYIAGKIKQIVDGPEPVLVDGGKRKAEYRDIVVLLRSVSSASSDYEKVFEAVGVPLYIESEKGYFDAAEISVLVSMLSIVDNSYVDIDLAAVLRSPLAGLNEEELARIAGEYRIQYEKDAKDYNARLYDKVRDYMECHDGEDIPAVKKLGAFLNMLDYLKENKNYMSISDIIRYILDETGYYWFAGARPMGKRRQANIDMLIRKADEFEKNSKGVFNFIRYVSELRTNDLDFAEADVVGENENVVRVMTMHKSKGLEFPIVFVAGLGKEFNQMDMRENVLVHQDYYLACNQIDVKSRVKRESFLRKVMTDTIRSETYAEEMRVLYVALTRAKEKLYMTACIKDMDSFIENCQSYVLGKRMNYAAVMSARCYAAWIYTALCYTEHDEYVVIDTVKADSFVGIPDDMEDKISDESLSECKSYTEDEEKSGFVGAVDAGLCDRIREGIEYEYGYKSSGLRSKMSITEIKRLQSQGEEIEFSGSSAQKVYKRKDNAPVPAFMCEERVVHGNEIGTIYHKIMELADFGQTDISGAERDVLRVFELGLFDDVYKNRIRPEKIHKMIQSGLGQRMAAADGAGRLFRERQFYMMMTPGEINSTYSDCGDETIVVQGIIDAYFIEDGEIVLMDYKTDTVKNVQDLVTKYHVQLEKYADVLEKLTGLKVKEKVIYSFCLDTTVNL